MLNHGLLKLKSTRKILPYKVGRLFNFTLIILLFHYFISLSNSVVSVSAPKKYDKFNVIHDWALFLSVGERSRTINGQTS